MPLIVLCGLPCSGKTQRTKTLKEFFELKKGKKVEVISEEICMKNAGFNKTTLYADSKHEKLVRSDLKSDLRRVINPQDVLIIDGSNYIKGYRYEIYCSTKEFHCTQCTIQCDLPVEHAWLCNERRPSEERYTREIFDALVLRYEPPDNKNRWDSPLFTVNPEDDLPLEEIYSALFEKKPPKPNMSTEQLVDLQHDYITQVDHITQEITNEIISAKKLGIENNIKIAKYGATVQSSGNIFQLNKLRKQFLTFNKTQPKGIHQIPPLFIQYLNANL